MWRMLQTEVPRDYVVATGTSYTVRDFLHSSFDHVGLDWQRHVKFDDRYLRPTEVDSLIGDATLAHTHLDWTATTHTPQLAQLMVDAELQRLQPGDPQILTLRDSVQPV